MMKKRLFGVMLLLGCALTACGKDTGVSDPTTGQQTTSSVQKSTEAIEERDSMKQKKSEDVTTANTIATAVLTSLSNEEVYNSVSQLDYVSFDIDSIKSAGGSGIVFGFSDKEISKQLSLLTKEVSMSLGDKTVIQYVEENWKPEIWRIWIKDGKNVEVGLVDGNTIKMLYPNVDEMYK